jgi:hypothetical protein
MLLAQQISRPPGEQDSNYRIDDSEHGVAEAFEKHVSDPITALGWPLDQVQLTLKVLSKKDTGDDQPTEDTLLCMKSGSKEPARAFELVFDEWGLRSAILVGDGVRKVTAVEVKTYSKTDSSKVAIKVWVTVHD